MTQSQNLINTILQAGGGDVVRQLAGQFGLEDSQVNAAIGQLMPAISQGVRSNAQQSGGVEQLLQALQKGNHSQYLDEPTRLSAPETTTDGNAILGHLFGSKDVSRNVATRAAQETGIGGDILKQLLPVLATAAMGALSKQQSGNGALSSIIGALAGGQQQQSGGLGSLMGLASAFLGGKKGQSSSQSGGSSEMSMLNQFLDSDGDGSVADDIMEMIARRAA